jgi:hypothetical protein
MRDTLLESNTGTLALAERPLSSDDTFGGQTKSSRVQLHTLQTGRRTATDNRPIFVSVGDADSSPLAARLDRAGLALGPVLRWGRESTCAVLVEDRPPLIVLDAPTTNGASLATLVHAASLIAPVAVLCPGGRFAVTAFRAGALDVLDRDAPAVELAWRIIADLRRCPPGSRTPVQVGRSASQRLLFDVVSKAATPVCCHHLRTLMATPGVPLSLPALKARIQRLMPALADQGLALVIDQQWGLATYRVCPA